ncbi:acyl carrier protein [Chloroflexi bacterium TSY]|nr:acyl carrier protein [Chloroflexi bacterium TSY]
MRESVVLQDRIATLILENVHMEVPTHETDLIETGILDSFGLVELIYQFEEEFGVPVPIHEIDFENFRSVTQMARFIEQRTGNSHNGFSPNGNSQNGYFHNGNSQ